MTIGVARSFVDGRLVLFEWGSGLGLKAKVEPKLLVMNLGRGGQRQNKTSRREISRWNESGEWGECMQCFNVRLEVHMNTPRQATLTSDGNGYSTIKIASLVWTMNQYEFKLSFQNWKIIRAAFFFFSITPRTLPTNQQKHPLLLDCTVSVWKLICYHFSSEPLCIFFNFYQSIWYILNVNCECSQSFWIIPKRHI